MSKLPTTKFLRMKEKFFMRFTNQFQEKSSSSSLNDFDVNKFSEEVYQQTIPDQVYALDKALYVFETSTSGMLEIDLKFVMRNQLCRDYGFFYDKVPITMIQRRAALQISWQSDTTLLNKTHDVRYQFIKEQLKKEQ
ncbi:hypothetical protein Tco_1531634 [Tanacetum coccineum]